MVRLNTSHDVSRPDWRYTAPDDPLTLKWYSPPESLLIVTGNRFDTTIKRCSFPPFEMSCAVCGMTGDTKEVGEEA
jgi:hypothetical protein